MSKKPTPKKQKAKSVSRKQYSKYVEKQTYKLANRNGSTKCSACDAIVLNHTVCSECGNYRGKKIIKSKTVNTDKITKIAA